MLGEREIVPAIVVGCQVTKLPCAFRARSGIEKGKSSWGKEMAKRSQRLLTSDTAETERLMQPELTKISMWNGQM